MRHQQQVTNQQEEIPNKSKQHAGLQACLPDTHISMRRATFDQQAKAGLQSSSNQHNMQWNMQQQSTHMTQCNETHWDHADASTTGATATTSPAAWKSKAASMSAKPVTKDPTLQPAGPTAVASVSAAAVLDLSTLGRTGSGNWVKPHKVQPGSTLVHGRIGLDLSVHDSHAALPPWSKAVATNHQVQQQQQQFSLLTEGGIDAAAHASAASAVVKGNSGRPSPAGERLHRQAALGQSSQQLGFPLEATALQQSFPANRIDSPQFGSPSAADVAAAADTLLQPPAAATAQVAAGSSAPMETDTNEATATEDLGPAAPPFAPRPKRQLAKGFEIAHNMLLQQQDLSGGWWGAGVDSQAGDRQDDSDDLLSREMPNLKKLRTMVQGLRVDSSDDLAALSSPAAADNTGLFIPTHPYSSPRMDQTTKSFANLDCGSAKGSPSVVRQSQKQSSLSRFAPAAAMATAAPHDPGVAAAADVCGNQSQQQAGAADQHGFDDDVAMHQAASQSAEAAGLTADDDEQWLKHNRELQQLKQQQEALRALLQQAEQQVKTPVSKDEEELSTGVDGKATPPAAQVPEAGAHGDSSSEGSQGRRTAESDAERVAAQMLAQEEGDWERAMQRMLNLVHSTMQHTNSTNISSNDRVAQLKRSTSGSASSLRRSASPAPAKQPSSPYAAAQHASPYFGSSTAAAAAAATAAAAADAGGCGQRGSPYPAAGPLSAVKLAWPMVPTSAVGSPVGSPAPCSPMVPSSAVGSPVMAPAAAAGNEFAAAGGVSGMMLPSSGWDHAAADPAGAARCGSPVHSQLGLVPDGWSPSGAPSAAAAARSRSPVCGSHRRVRPSTRQQSRMAPTPQRTSVRSVTEDSMCTRAAAAVSAAELGITSAGPGTRTYTAAKAAAASAAAAVAAAEHCSAGSGPSQLRSPAADAAAGALSVDPDPNTSLDFTAAGRLGLSISAAGPGAYPDVAAAAGTDVAFSQSATFVTDAAAAAAGAAPRPRVSAAPTGSNSQDTTAAATAAAAAAAAAAAVPTLADVLGIGMTMASERHQGYGHYAGAATAAAPADETVSNQQLQQYQSQAGFAAAAAGSFAAHSSAPAASDEPQHQQQQQAADTTAAAAAAAFSNVPTLSVDAVLDDAAGWLFGANGLLPDTPGPNNFMARPGQAGAGDGNAKQQQQLEASARAQMYSGNALRGATTAAATLVTDHSNSAAADGYGHLEQQQSAMPAAAATAAAAALQPILQQEQQKAQQQCFPTGMHGVEASAATSQGSQPTADFAAASTAMYGMHTAADSWHYDAAAAAMTWQHQCATAGAAAPSYSGGDVAVAMQHYQQQQQLGSLPQQDAVTAPAAAAATAGGDSQGSQELGSDKDDIALLQVLLGWASDEV